jgi:hypothetical protein
VRLQVRDSTTYSSCLALSSYYLRPVPPKHPCSMFMSMSMFMFMYDLQAFEVAVVSARDHNAERWLESAKETEGVDVDSVFQRFPHGLKIMLQAP